MRLCDPTGGQGSKVSIFVASLPYSGMVFACACADERQDAWLGECPILCVRGFGLQVVRESVGVSHG